MRVAVIGRTKWLLDAAARIAGRGHTVPVVWTCAAEPFYDTKESAFEAFAREKGAAFICEPSISSPESVARLRTFGCDVAISVNWLTVLSPAVLALFPHGIINAHAGDLPRFRGNACPNWAILADERQVVLTLHRMSEALDAGPVFLKKAFALDERTYIGDVYDFLGKTVPEAFVEVVEGLSRGTLVPSPQDPDPAKSLRCFPRRPEDSELVWTRSAPELARMVRASAEPFSGAFTHLEGRKLVVWRARAGELPYAWLGVPGQVAAIDAASGEVTVLAGRGVLILEQVDIGEGRSKPAALIRSNRARLSTSPR